MKTSIIHAIRLLMITVIFATYGCGDENKPSSNKDDIEEDSIDDNKNQSPLVEDITQNRVFDSWYKEIISTSEVNERDLLTLEKKPTYNYIGMAVNTSIDGVLLKKHLVKQTLDLETLMSNPETKGQIEVMRVLLHETLGHSQTVKIGAHSVTLVNYGSKHIRDRVRIFISHANIKRRDYPPLKDFEESLYSEALGSAVQKYSTHILTDYYTGFIARAYTCAIPKALREDGDADVQKELIKLLKKLNEAGLKKHLRKDGSLLYYHINLMGGSYDRNNTTIFDPEKEDLNLKKWIKDTMLTNSYIIFTDKENFTPIYLIANEVNFKDRLHPDYIKFAPKKEITPFIEIVRVKTDINEDYYDVGACLHTRNGDRILLTKSLNPRDETQKRKLIQYQNEEGFKEATQTLKQVLSKLFTLEIKVNETDKLKYHRHEKYLYKFCILDEARELIPIKKAFVPSIRRYVIYTDTQRPEKIAFFATEDNKASKVEEMLNLYGMKQLTDHINEETLSKMSFVNMIGL
ncbi:hypothetical protein [Porphyromonas cangingivalis]|uniref:hypothetical protein n=1 Tax=Porphyromonas cangingivalis TaxID=36874 RepID=UPI000AB68397|nr:hypothetical protein [Porphyromonas cangingivalis]